MWLAELRKPDSDRGFATVWAACAVAVLAFLGAFLFWLGAATAVRHRAESAADLAALAAAGEVSSGSEAACARARWVTDGMNVALSGCRVHQGDAFVEVQAALPGMLSRFGGAGARARAGPVDRPTRPGGGERQPGGASRAGPTGGPHTSSGR